MINKAQFSGIIKDLDLKLSPLMLRQYVDVNFKFVDRALAGKIAFGQFLACYANFLYSFEISQVRIYTVAPRGAPYSCTNVRYNRDRTAQQQPHSTVEAPGEAPIAIGTDCSWQRLRLTPLRHPIIDSVVVVAWFATCR